MSLRDILEIVVSFFAGYSLKWVFVVRTKKQMIQQSGNVVGGNMAGRDVTIRQDDKK